jgi:hypothetical protein
MEGLGIDPFSFEIPTYALEGLRTDLSSPEVSTYEMEAIMATEMATESPIEPTFLDSEPTCVGRKRKAKDMSGLTLCLCEERAEPGDVGSIQCRKAGCATVWVCYSATFNKFVADTAHSIIFNVLGMRTHDQEAGYVSLACASQALVVRNLGVARRSATSGIGSLSLYIITYTHICLPPYTNALV